MEEEKPQLRLGDIVKMNGTFLGEKKGVLAYVYEVYHLGKSEPQGVSIITITGKNIGGFDSGEQEEYLERVRHSGFYYQFKNVIQLDRDFETQIKPVFN